MGTDPERAVVLLSGGLDSVTVVAMARATGADVYALSFSYGQRHNIELQCAARQAQRLGVVRHEVIDIHHFGALVAPATALVAASDLRVPKPASNNAAGDTAASDAEHVPVTYVPARNTVFLSYALAWAEVVDASTIWIGVNALDYSGYPDCRPEFIAAFSRVAMLATRRGTEGQACTIRAPLQHMHKHEIIHAGTQLGVDYADTVSCYDPIVHCGRPLACGQCDSCRLRRQGFESAGIQDPTGYRDPT